MKDKDNLIEVDFKKKKVILEEDIEYIPGYTRSHLEFIILKINFTCCFSTNLEEISKSLLLMSDLTGALYEHQWFNDITDFFEDYLSKNTHWHIKSCNDESKREYLKDEYWKGIINTWRG